MLQTQEPAGHPEQTELARLSADCNLGKRTRFRIALRNPGDHETCTIDDFDWVRSRPQARVPHGRRHGAVPCGHSDRRSCKNLPNHDNLDDESCQIRRPGDLAERDPWLCVPASRPVCRFGWQDEMTRRSHRRFTNIAIKYIGCEWQIVKKILAVSKAKEQSIPMSIRRTFVVSYAVLAVGRLPRRPGPAARSAEPAATPQLAIETYVLANGLKVALSRDPAAPRTTVSVAYHVGSKNERPGLTGFAHFFEHMMFRGTQNVPNFDQPLQEAGGASNAFTSEDVTVYFETIPNNYVQRALYLEAERMAFLSSALNQEKFDTEREVVKNERRQGMENVPYGLADETLSFYAFPKGHPYSWSVIGSMEDLSRATLEDLRQFFLEFYHPANATLTMVGGFAPDETKRWIETYFGPLAAGPELADSERAPDGSDRASAWCRRIAYSFRGCIGRGPPWPRHIPTLRHWTCWRCCCPMAMRRG